MILSDIICLFDPKFRRYMAEILPIRRKILYNQLFFKLNNGHSEIITKNNV